MQAIADVIGTGISAVLPTFWPEVGDQPGSEWDPSGEAGNGDGISVVLGLLADQGVPNSDQLAALIDPDFLARLLGNQQGSSRAAATPPSNVTYTQFGTPTTADIAALGATLDLLDNNELPSDSQPPPTSLPHDQQLTSNPEPVGNQGMPATNSAQISALSILGITLASTAFDSLYA
jgi:hypothetical protein